MSTSERERFKALESEVEALRRANEILRLASAFVAKAEFNLRLKSFFDQHRDSVGVEPICKVLRIAPSRYGHYAAQLRDLSRRCAHAKRDEFPRSEIKWV